jgi:hypothetical protein
MRTRVEKPAAIQFPDTPSEPAFAEMHKRLERFLLCHHAVSTATTVPGATKADHAADSFLHSWLLKGALESIEEIGPISSSQQRAMFLAHGTKVKLLVGNDPKEAA